MYTALTVCILALSVIQARADWELIFEDDFEGWFLDESKWIYDCTAWGGGNSEFQVYTPSDEHTYLQDGKLFIKPKLLINSINPKTGLWFGEDFMRNGVLDLKDMYGYCSNGNREGCRREGRKGNMPPIMSGRILTKSKFSFTYGRVEIRAKMPVGDWMWPAIWMLPEDKRYGGWPMSGEIDLVETIANIDLKDGNGQWKGTQRMGATLHWGASSSQNRYYKTGGKKTDDLFNYGDFFHTYTMTWDPEGIRIDVDGDRVLTVNKPRGGFWEYGKPWNGGTRNPWARGSQMAPFDQRFHFLFNVAVGGTNGFIPDGLVNQGGRYPKPWSNRQWWYDAQRDFYNKRGDWEWTWEDEGDNAAMQVDYIKVWQYK